ncbi:MAG: DNA repair protein RecO [Bacillota bacterium]
MALYTTEAIVLRERDLGEADRILTLFTRDKGKVEAVAKGARRPRSRLAGFSQPFSYGLVSLFSGRNLETVSQAELRESFGALRADLDRMAYAAYAVDLVDEVTRERDRHEELFYVLLSMLHLLTGEVDRELLIRALEIKVLAAAGFRPRLEDCAACGGTVGDAVRFSPEAGGLVCGNCPAPGAIRLSRGALETMRRLLGTDFRRLTGLRWSQAIRAEIGAVLDSYVVHCLERRPRSWAFLSTVRALG